MATVKRTELANVVAQLASKTSNQKKLAKEIASYLVKTHQTRQLDSILRNVVAVRERAGIVEVNVTSAFPLSSSVQKAVTQIVKSEYPTAKQVVVNQALKPEVLSGIKLQTNDKQLDETARGKLEKLRRMHV